MVEAVQYRELSYYSGLAKGEKYDVQMTFAILKRYCFA